MSATLPPIGFDEVIISGTPYFVPKASCAAPWGTELNSYLLALGAGLTGLSGAFDVNGRLAIFSSAPTSSTTIPNVNVDPSVLAGAILQYSARITTSSVTASEIGFLIASYNSNNAASSKFDVAKVGSNNAGLSFYITDLGQVQVSAPSAAGTGYSMRLRINMKAFEI